MADLWLPGFERCPSSHAGGGTMLDVPRKWTGHTVEGYSKNPAAQASGHATPPHCWATLPSHPYKKAWRGQIVPLNRSAFALKHNPGDPETNKAGAIQVEIEGFSVNFDELPDVDQFEITVEDMNWLTDMVVRPMCEATGVDMTKWVDTYDGVPRLGWDVWRNYNGLCTHRNVPGNTHTDMPINLGYISARLTSGSGNLVPTSASGEGMPCFQHRPPHPTTKEVLRITADGVLQTMWQTNPNGPFGPFAQIKGTLDPSGAARFEPNSLSVLAPSDINPSPTLFAAKLGQPNTIQTYFYDYVAGKWAGPANAN